MERGLALDPDYPYGRGELLHMRMYSADWHDFAERKAELEAPGSRRQTDRPAIHFPGHRGNTRRRPGLFAHLGARQNIPGSPHRRTIAPARKAHKKIRIGYLSGEFRQQATAILMAGLYERHDRDQFEIVALDTGVNDQSEMRGRLEKAFDRWIDIGALSDAEAAQRDPRGRRSISWST